MDQIEIIRILVTGIGALNYGLNAYQEGFRKLLKWDAIFLMILMTLMFVPLSLGCGVKMDRRELNKLTRAGKK